MKLNLVAAVSLFCCTAAFSATEKELIASALQHDYQAQRNLAFSYKNGWSQVGEDDFFPKDNVKSCAWRKIILIANSNKADTGDYMNESVDCSAVHVNENEEVWKYVYIAIKGMSKN